MLASLLLQVFGLKNGSGGPIRRQAGWSPDGLLSSAASLLFYCLRATFSSSFALFFLFKLTYLAATRTITTQIKAINS